MSQNYKKLLKGLSKKQLAAGLSKQGLTNVLKKLGKFQAMADSRIKDYSNPQNYSKLQSKMAALQLDDQAISKVVSEIRQFKKSAGLSSGSLKEKKVAGLLTKLRQVQTRMARTGAEPAAISKNAVDLQKIMNKVDSMITGQLKKVNWKSGKVKGLMKKLKG